MATIAQLMVNIGANIGDFKQGTNEVRSELKSLVGDVAKISATVFASIAAVMAPISAYGLKISSDMQQAKISMETMLGSTEKADAMIKDLWAFAASTPFEFNELQTATKRMLAFGFSAEDIIPDLTAVGDAAAGLGIGAEGVNRITLALGQMKAKGKVSGDEMLQLTEAGIPVWDILSKSIGKTTAETMKFAEKGVIPADQAIQALLAGMAEKFPGMMDKQSKSMAGLFSTLKDNISIVLMELFKPAVAWLTDVGLPKLIDMTTKFSDTIKSGGSVTDAINSMFTDGFDGVLSQMGTIGEYLTRIGNTIAWVKDNANLLVPVLIELAAAFVALQIIQSVLGPIEALVVTGIVLVSVISAICIAMGNMAAAAAMAPIIAELVAVFAGLTLVSAYVAVAVLAIGTLIAVGYLVYANWDSIKNSLIAIWNTIVNFVADNINIMIALFPALGLAAYVIYEYWGDAVNAANKVINWLAEQVAFIRGKIINEFNYYSKMWDDFVNWAKQGVANFRAELASIVESFIPNWARSLLGGVQTLGEQLARKTAEIGKAMRENLTVELPGSKPIQGVADFKRSEDSNTLPPGIPAITSPAKTPATIKPADWSGVDFSGGGSGSGSGVSDEEKAANDAAKAFEDLQKAAKATSDSIKSEWISLTGTQMDALNNWHDKELDDLNKSASANENYTNDLSRLDEIYAAKKKKILADQQKDSNSIWDKALSDATTAQEKLNSIGLTGVDKQKFDISTDAIKQIEAIKEKYRDLSLEYESGTAEQKLQMTNAWKENSLAFELMEDGTVRFAQRAASDIAVVEKEKNQKIADLHEARTKYEQKLDEAYKDGNLTAYAAALNSEQGLLAQQLSGKQAMLDEYYKEWQATHMSTIEVMANLRGGMFDGLTNSIKDLITSTSTLGEAWVSLRGAIIDTIATMIAKWVAGQLMMAIFGKTTMAAGTAASVAAAATTATAWAPAATMVSLASWGANSAPAMAGISATSALSAGLAIAGLATGGPVSGAGTGTSDSILTWLSNGEYVIKASAVKALGIDNLNTLNAGQMPAFATGGLVTGASLSSVSSGYSTATTATDNNYKEATNATASQPPTENHLHLHNLDSKSTERWLNNGGGKQIAKFFGGQAKSFGLEG